ncbi:MAG: DNA/RNA nuclease SfsA [Alphaproteobacteria bacterium]|nr:MAG: DNA/RNA nuclease SfsA [Alphaproteobacteria bacterium]
MEWPSPLRRGVLLKRYKRFLADIELPDGEMVTAHCANPGAMTGLKDPGLPAFLSTSDNPKRKLKFSLEAVEVGGKLVGINTAHPNRIVEEAITAGQVPELLGYERLRREVRYGENSRIDVLLEDDAKGLAYVEVKNVHLMREAGLAEFPDSVTARGAKHLVELAHVVGQGHRAVMFYLVQRMDCDRLSIAADIDKTYAEALEMAMKSGVEVIAYDCDISLYGIELRRPVALAL